MKSKKNAGGDLKFIEDQKTGEQETMAVNFQWNESKNGGFITGEPWLKVNENHSSINATA
jgi:oligo-1,6-glucosidase